MSFGPDNLNKEIKFDEIIKNASPKIYKKLPGIALWALKKILHQDDINSLLRRFGTKDGVDFINEVFRDLDVEIKICGLENLAKGEQYIFASNHPLGALDGLALIKVVNENHGKAKAIVNDLLLHIGSLKSVFTGVNLYGHNNKQVIDNLDELYSSGQNIVVFPAGLVSRKNESGQILDRVWKKNFLTNALDKQISIIPTYVDAKDTDFFYNIAQRREKMGIKFNYELVLLPREVFKFKKKTITIYFERPVSPQMLNSIDGQRNQIDFVRLLSYSAKENYIKQQNQKNKK